MWKERSTDMLPVAENVPAPGSYSSALAWDESPDWPPTSSARPSSRSVAVEPPPQSAVRVPAGSNVRLAGSKRSAALPDATSTFPVSGRRPGTTRDRRPCYRRASSPLQRLLLRTARGRRGDGRQYDERLPASSARRKQARDSWFAPLHAAVVLTSCRVRLRVGMTRLKKRSSRLDVDEHRGSWAVGAAVTRPTMSHVRTCVRDLRSARVRPFPARARAPRALGGRGRSQGDPALAPGCATARPSLRRPTLAEVRAGGAPLAREVPGGDSLASRTSPKSRRPWRGGSWKRARCQIETTPSPHVRTTRPRVEGERSHRLDALPEKEPGRAASGRRELPSAARSGLFSWADVADVGLGP